MAAPRARGYRGVNKTRRGRDLLMPKREALVEVQNVVASVAFNQSFDLLSIVKAFPVMVAWNPDRFPGLVFKLKDPRTATLIFSSGRMVCTGAKSEILARRAVRRVVDELKSRGIVITSGPVVRSRMWLPPSAWAGGSTWNVPSTPRGHIPDGRA